MWCYFNGYYTSYDCSLASEARAELKCFFRLDVTFTDIVYSEISIGFRFGLVLC